MPVSLRELRRDDWAALKAIRLEALTREPGMFYASAADAAARTDEEWQELAQPTDRQQLFGLFDGEDLIGITAVFTEHADPTDASAHFAMSYIKPEYRGRGLARRFYEARLAWVRERPQFRKIIVSHREGNEPSRRANQRWGFTCVGTEPHDWPDGTPGDEVLYELVVEPFG